MECREVGARDAVESVRDAKYGREFHDGRQGGTRRSGGQGGTLGVTVKCVVRRGVCEEVAMLRKCLMLCC